MRILILFFHPRVWFFVTALIGLGNAACARPGVSCCHPGGSTRRNASLRHAAARIIYGFAPPARLYVERTRIDNRGKLFPPESIGKWGSVREWTRLGFSIVDVNKFVYNVSLTAENREYSSNIPGAFSAVFLPAKGAAHSAAGSAPSEAAARTFDRALANFNLSMNALHDVAAIDEYIVKSASALPRITRQGIEQLKKLDDDHARAVFERVGAAKRSVLGSVEDLARVYRPPVPMELIDRLPTTFEDSSTITQSEQGLTALVAAAEALLTYTHQKLGTAEDEVRGREYLDAEGRYLQLTVSENRPSPRKPPALDVKFARSARLFRQVADGSAFRSDAEITARGRVVVFVYSITPKDRYKSNPGVVKTKSKVVVPVLGGTRELQFEPGLVQGGSRAMRPGIRAAGYSNAL